MRGRTRISGAFLACFLLFPLSSAGGDSAQDGYSLQEARKVLSIIDTLIVQQMKPNPDLPEKITLSESELNSYIAHRILTEEEEIMKALQLKLFQRNKIEGKLSIDLRGQNLPSFLRPEMTVLFAGRLEVNESRIRLNLSDLFLENQRVQPLILDAIIALGSRAQNMEVTSINDWYDLPYGIQDVKTDKGQVDFYFR